MQQQQFEQKPVVLCFSGLDPCGGAGIQADIESIISTGCHAASIVTCITAQNTQRVDSWHPVAPGMIAQQARMILQDMPVAAIKIGMIGTLEILDIIVQVAADNPDIPIVLDPVLKSGSGQDLAQQEFHAALLEQLVPLTTLMTPNSIELTKLTGASHDIEAAVFALLGHGCQSVCVTGGHLEPESTKIRNRLWQDYRLIYDRNWNKIEGEFHGTGCTFASAAAGFLAQGMSINQAVIKADEYTWQAVSKALQLGLGQSIPHRTHWLSTSPRRPVARRSILTH